MKLRIILNAKWDSIETKAEELRGWFYRKIKLDIQIVNTTFTEIPFVLYGEKDYWGIDPKWYDENILPLSEGCDIALFVVETKDWHIPNDARGWRTDNDEGVVELQISADENESLTYVTPNGTSYVSTTFFEYARHEILHALFLITGQKDTTHFWWDRKQFDLCLEELDFSSRTSLINIIKQKLNAIIYLFNSFKSMTQIERIADAIKEMEGYYTGSRSFRNRNPGNLKWTPYTKSLGAIDKDSGGFAIFPSTEAGRKAIIQLIKDAKNGLLKAYRPTMTLLEFFSVYAPAADKNNPTSYSATVAKKVGISINTKLNQLT